MDAIRPRPAAKITWPGAKLTSFPQARRSPRWSVVTTPWTGTNAWERTKLGWDAIVLGQGKVETGLPSEAVARSYAENVTDEVPLCRTSLWVPMEKRVPGWRTSVIFFNFRADRARQLSLAFLRDDFSGFDRGGPAPKVHYVTLTEYDETYGCPVAFPPQTLNDVLGEVVSRAGLSQLRLAETEKYPHVSYFFNGGVEEPYPGEERQMIPSPKVATYDLQPEMSALELTELLLKRLPDFDLVIVNYANPDMVGHTGVPEGGGQGGRNRGRMRRARS